MPLCPRRPSLKTTTEIENYESPPPPGPWPHPAASKPLHQLALIAAAFTLLNLQHAHLQAGPPEWANACVTMCGKCRGTYCTCTIMRMHSCTHTLAHAVPCMELFAQPIFAASYFRHVLSVLVLRSSASIFSFDHTPRCTHCSFNTHSWTINYSSVLSPFLGKKGKLYLDQIMYVITPCCSQRS